MANMSHKWGAKMHPVSCGRTASQGPHDAEDGDETETERRKTDGSPVVSSIEQLTTEVSLRNMTVISRLRKVKALPQKRKFVVRMKVKGLRSFGVATSKAAACGKAAKTMMVKLGMQINCSIDESYVDMLTRELRLRETNLISRLVAVKALPQRKKCVVQIKVNRFRSIGIGPTTAAAEEIAAQMMLTKLRAQEDVTDMNVNNNTSTKVNIFYSGLGCESSVAVMRELREQPEQTQQESMGCQQNLCCSSRDRNKCRRECDDLRDILTNSGAAQLACLQEKLKCCREELFDMGKRLSETEDCLKRCQSDVEDKCEIIRSLNCTLEELSCRLHERTARVDELERTIENLNKDNEKRMKRVDEQLKKYECELCDKAKQIADLDDCLSSCQHNLSEICNELCVMEQKNARLVSVLCACNAKLKESEDTRECLGKVLTESRAQTAEVSQELRSTREQLQQKQQELMDCQQNLCCSNREWDKYRRECDDLRNVLTENARLEMCCNTDTICAGNLTCGADNQYESDDLGNPVLLASPHLKEWLKLPKCRSGSCVSGDEQNGTESPQGKVDPTSIDTYAPEKLPNLQRVATKDETAGSGTSISVNIEGNLQRVDDHRRCV